ncbi:paraquat-inducible protein A [Aequorivita sp. CIP111184]|uniref:paraquat-inducible protein A n=1 Tax=Aequorivita sp. CIP111184 TaxID=2211356 RepID=UPI000DBC37CE|nr:paraquat-inducible protein A [Aequorivita sp. CIP111184]SRX56221.1 hypothetical protein AEQU1_03251 [Aequorivita sp. CIP111184]
MRIKYIITLFLSFSIIFFILGLTYPLLVTKQQVFGVILKYQEIKLFDSVKIFYKNNDYLLAAIIFLFTIILPIIKFLELLNRNLIFYAVPKKISHILHSLDKWSMLDVFLVALLLLNFKMDSNLIVMKLQIGTTFITLSIITRMITVAVMDYYHRD